MPSGNKQDKHELYDDQGLDEGDTRALLIAQNTINIRQNWAVNSPREGCEKAMMAYRFIYPVTWIMLAILWLDIFFSAPSWCTIGMNIDQACRYYTDGTYVIRSPMPIFRTIIFTVGTPQSIVVLTVLRTWKYRLIRSQFAERAVCYALWFIVGVWFTDKLLILAKVYEASFKDVIVMFFLMVYTDAVRKCTVKMFTIMSFGIDVLIIYFLVSIFFASMNRILFYDHVLEDSPYVWITYSDKSFIRMFTTVLTFFPASNFPGLMVEVNTFSKWQHWFIICELFVNSNIVIAIVQSSLYFYYQSFYVKSMNALKEDDKLHYLLYWEFIDDNDIHPKVLKYIVETHYENPDHCFASDEQLAKLKEKYENIAFSANQEQEKRLNFYKDNFPKLRKFRSSLGWKIWLFICDLVIAICMIIYVDYYYMYIINRSKAIDTADDRADIVQDLNEAFGTTQVLDMIKLALNLFGVIDIMLKIQCKGFHSLWKNFGSVLYVISTIGLCCYNFMLQGIDDNFGDYRIFDQFASLFTIGIMFICLKILAVFLTFGKRMKIIKVLLQVMSKAFVLCKSLYQMLFILLLLFSSIGMYLFGGNITSKTPEEYNKVTGGSVSAGADLYNFNDYWCSILCCLAMIFGGWSGTDSLMMYKDLNRYNKWIYEYFFISYFFFVNLCLVNVVTSFFVDSVMCVAGEVLEEGGDEGEGEGDEEEGDAENPKGEIELSQTPKAEIDVDVEPEVNGEVNAEADGPETKEIDAPVGEVDINPVDMSPPEAEVVVDVDAEGE